MSTIALACRQARRALELVHSEAERRFLQRRLDELADSATGGRR